MIIPSEALLCKAESRDPEPLAMSRRIICSPSQYFAKILTRFLKRKRVFLGDGGQSLYFLFVTKKKKYKL